MRRQLHLLFHLRELFIERRDALCGLLFLPGDGAQLRQQFLPAFIVVIDHQRRGNGGELVVERQRRIPAGGADQNQIRHLRGDRFGAGFPNIKTRNVALFRDIPPLT